MNKILYLTYEEFVQDAKDWGCSLTEVKGTYRIGLKITKLFRLFPFLKLPQIMKHLLGDWKKNLSEYDMVLIFADRSAPALSRAIHSVEPKTRIVIYYDNCCKAEISPDAFDRSFTELWSFDPEDCKKYQLKYNPPFLFFKKGMDFDKLKISENSLYDIYFLGRDKGRGEELVSVKKQLEAMGLDCEFHLVETKGVPPIAKELYREPISYEESILKIADAKAVLDWNIEGQSGITQRPLECLFLKKKLITNNGFIKNYDFYDPENIFIWGEDDPKALCDWLARPYRKLPETVIAFYGVENWCKRFYLQCEE